MVGVQLLPSHNGNKYAVVFMDYFTKWPATEDQTIAHLLVEHVIARHGVLNSCYPIEELIYTLLQEVLDQHIWIPPAM